MYRFCLIIFCFVCVRSIAHPGIGIVKDSKGFIYYTDLEKVWKINPETLDKTVVVPNVHTHELYIDKSDNLFGQHSLYSGEQTNQWSHYIWRLNSNGSIERIVPLSEGFYIDKFSFVRDKNGNTYWNQHWKTNKIVKQKRMVMLRF